MKNNPVPAIEQTYKSIKTILEKARSKSSNAVNAAMMQTYWHNVTTGIIEKGYSEVLK